MMTSDAFYYSDASTTASSMDEGASRAASVSAVQWARSRSYSGNEGTTTTAMSEGRWTPWARSDTGVVDAVETAASSIAAVDAQTTPLTAVTAELNRRIMDAATTVVTAASSSENWNWTSATMTKNWSEFPSWWENSTIETTSPALLRHSNVLYTVLTCLVLGAVILAAIVGNAFVIAAIVLERNLHSVANYLIASLAVADLLVAALVMPLAAVNEISSRWFFGSEACDAFVSFDVLCCTASILHLVAISVDRYWAVTRVDYIHNRPVGRIFAMIALSWAISTVISIPPLFGWKSPDNDPDVTGVCLISQDWGYTVYSTLGAFYIPLGFMIAIYLNVYRAARSRIRKKQFRRQTTTTTTAAAQDSDDATRSASVVNGRQATVAAPGPSTSPSPPRPAPPSLQLSLDTPTTPTALIPPDVLLDTAISTVDEDGDAAMLPPTSPTSLEFANGTPPAAAGSTAGSVKGRAAQHDAVKSQRLSTERRATKKREQMRERKAARTLGVITGSFVVCWLPFFILALVRPFCGDRCHYPDLLVSVIGWLGYFNSLLNPIIYTVFNPDFRLAFRKILFGKYRAGETRGSFVGGRTGRTRLHNGSSRL